MVRVINAEKHFKHVSINVLKNIFACSVKLLILDCEKIVLSKCGAVLYNGGLGEDVASALAGKSPNNGNCHTTTVPNLSCISVNTAVGICGNACVPANRHYLTEVVAVGVSDAKGLCCVGVCAEVHSLEVGLINSAAVLICICNSATVINDLTDDVLSTRERNHGVGLAVIGRKCHNLGTLGNVSVKLSCVFPVEKVLGLHEPNSVLLLSCNGHAPYCGLAVLGFYGEYLGVTAGYLVEDSVGCCRYCLGNKLTLCPCHTTVVT